MIRDYFRGHRVIYQNPVSTFLIAISIVALCNGIFGQIVHDGAKKEQITIFGLIDKLVTEDILKKADKNSDIGKAYEQWNAKRSMKGHSRMAAALKVVKEKLTSDVSLTLFALFPLLGSISYLTFRKRAFDGRRLTLMEHYVIFVYLYAFFSFTDDFEVVHFFYVAWAYRGIYRLSWLKSMGYATFVFGLAIIAVAVFIFILIGLMLAPVMYYYNVAAL